MLFNMWNPVEFSHTAEIRKDEAYLKLDLTRHLKGNKKNSTGTSTVIGRLGKIWTR